MFIGQTPNEKLPAQTFGEYQDAFGVVVPS